MQFIYDKLLLSNFTRSSSASKKSFGDFAYITGNIFQPTSSDLASILSLCRFQSASVDEVGDKLTLGKTEAIEGLERFLVF